MIKTALKTIGTLTAGCVVGVVVALSWTGQGDLDATLNYVSRLESLIQVNAGNADELLAQLNEQQRIYRNDVKVYYNAVKEGNAQTSKANDEITKANDAAAKLALDMKNEVERLENKYGTVNEIPGLVENPEVNHQGGEHENTGDGGVITKPNITHNGDIVITYLGENKFNFENVTKKTINVEYTNLDGTITSIRVPGTDDEKDPEVYVTAKFEGGTFKYYDSVGATVTGKLNGRS